MTFERLGSLFHGMARDTQNTAPQRGKARGRGGHSSRGGGRSGSKAHGAQTRAPATSNDVVAVTDAASNASTATSTQVAAAKAAAAAAAAAASQTDDDDEAEICFICAEPVRLFSLPPCNHRVCHICSMRLRALWKKRECTFCKAEATRVIFTANATKAFGAYTPDELPYVDEKLAIYFETEQDYQDTISLLRFNCPNPKCEAMCAGWADLKTHVKREHSRLLCDLCIKHKKIFSHEHTLYTAASLQAHLTNEHHYCEYCRQHFYSDDELWVHMRDNHEQCHICKHRSEEERWRYYKDYRMLEQHFKKEHYLCPARECLEKKFVVFENQMEFQVHQVQEHGHTLSSREKRDALRVDASFMYTEEPSSSSTRRPAKNRERGAANAPTSSRRAQFGSTLSSSGASASANTGENDPFWSTVLTVLNDSTNKLTACKAALQSYAASEMTAQDVLQTVMNVTGEGAHSFDVGTADLVLQSMSEILQNNEKKEELRRAWASVKAQHTQAEPFPTLAAAQNSHSVRSLKSAASGNARVWDNVARAASSKAPARTPDQFPSLRAASSRVPGSAAHSAGSLQRVRANAGHSSWGAAAPPPSSSNAFPALGTPAPSSTPRPASVRVGGASASGKSAALSSNHFPSLPTSSAHAERQAQKRELFGTPRTANPLVPTAPASRWGASSSSASTSLSAEAFPSLQSMSGALPRDDPVASAAAATPTSGKQRRRKGVLLSSVGSMHHV